MMCTEAKNVLKGKEKFENTHSKVYWIGYTCNWVEVEEIGLSACEQNVAQGGPKWASYAADFWTVGAGRMD